MIDVNKSVALSAAHASIEAARDALVHALRHIALAGGCQAEFDSVQEVCVELGNSMSTLYFKMIEK